MTKYFLLLLFLRIFAFFFHYGLNAQQAWFDNEVIYEEAMEYMDGEEYREALPLLELLLDKGVENSNIKYRLGYTLLNIEGKKTESIPYLEDAVKDASAKYTGKYSEKNAPLSSLLSLGIAYRIDNQLDNAIKTLKIYYDSVDNDELKNVATFYINQVKVAKLFLAYPSGQQLLKINDISKYSIYNPVVLSRNSVFYMEKRPFYNAVVSGTIKENAIRERENLTPIIGADDEIILVSVSPSEDLMIFTAYITGLGDELFYSEKDSLGKWSRYKPFSKPINSPSNESFASVTGDGNKLYFSSNRHGGHGGLDLYVSQRNSFGEWSEPQNLGPQVNTSFNEDVCYISEDDSLLLLSSKGHVNIGGYDLFYSKRDTVGNWSIPMNFGAPISTTDDDNFISMSNDNYLYFSQYDSYNPEKQATFSWSLNKESLEKKVLVTTQLEFDEQVKPKEVSYIIYSDESEEAVRRSVTDKNGFSQNLLGVGSYIYKFIYNDDISADQKLVITNSINTDELTLVPPLWDVPTVKSEERTRVLLIRDILFNFDSYEILRSYYNLLDSVAIVMHRDKNAKVYVDGHTDDFGPKEYNIRLSEKRSEAVGKYLMRRGVGNERIILHGKGEELPIAINRNNDGTDNIEGRKYNRRVSLTVETGSKDVIIKKIVFVPSELLLK